MRRRVPVLVTAAAVVAGLVAAPVAAATSPAASPSAAVPIYHNPQYSPVERAADLDSRMTLADKAAQMNSSQAPAIPRLGVEAWGWWNEAAHGAAREQVNDGANPPTYVNTTSYPVDLSLGSRWDRGLMPQEAALISDELRDIVRDTRFDLDFYSPTVNLQRDPRWGRNDDGYLKAVATLKHFTAGDSEFNRRTGGSDMDQRMLREYYTAQFRNIIQQSPPRSIMSAYNEVRTCRSPGTPTRRNVRRSVTTRSARPRSTFAERPPSGPPRR